MAHLSLEALLQSIQLRSKECYDTTPINPDNSPTSIRFKPSTKHFLQCQAEAMNTSVQSIISMILDGVAQTNNNPITSIIQKIEERFLHLFKAHDMSLTDITTVMKDFGFTLGSFQKSSHSSGFLDLLNPTSIRFLSDTFHVDPQWLSGSIDTVMVPFYDFFDHIPDVISQLNFYTQLGLNPHILLIREEFRGHHTTIAPTAQPYLIGALIKLHHNKDGVLFETYKLLGVELFLYQQNRQSLLDLMDFCRKTSPPI